MGTLYLVSTPIGNLKDITLRALDTLKEVDLIACEDTRHTGLLLHHYDIKKTLLSFHEHNEQERMPQLLARLIQGESIALVSDAGTPTIADPGFKLVRTCREQQIPVVAIPGPNAAITALTASGLSTDKFLFIGYLPKKQGKRKTLLTDLKTVLETVKTTLIFYEAPHRLLEVLADMQEVLGDRPPVVCRELTKMHEEILHLSISEAIAHCTNHPPKGEFTLLI